MSDAAVATPFWRLALSVYKRPFGPESSSLSVHLTRPRGGRSARVDGQRRGLESRRREAYVEVICRPARLARPSSFETRYKARQKKMFAGS